MVTNDRLAQGMTFQQDCDQMGTSGDALYSLRDKNPDLMDQYLNQGMFRSIPVFAFFDENMTEMARFIERPKEQTEEIEKKMLEVRRALRAERYLDWRGGVVREIRSLLKA